MIGYDSQPALNLHNMRGALKFGGLAGFSLIGVCALTGVFNRAIDVALRDGGSARITPASSLRALRNGATATIWYQPRGAQAGTIVLWQDFFHHPVMVLAAADTNVLLCLYEFDVGLRLLRINPAKKFNAFSAGSELGFMVSTSPWEVEMGKTNDWYTVLEYIKGLRDGEFKRQVVPTLNLGGLRLRWNRDRVLERLETDTNFTTQN